MVRRPCPERLGVVSDYFNLFTTRVRPAKANTILFVRSARLPHGAADCISATIIQACCRGSGILYWQFVVNRHNSPVSVMPANAGIQYGVDSLDLRSLDPGFRRGDESNFNKLLVR